MIQKMMEIIPQSQGKFCSVFPKQAKDHSREHQKQRFDREI